MVAVAPWNSPLVTGPVPVTCSMPSAMTSVKDRSTKLVLPLFQVIGYGVLGVRLGRARQEAPGRSTVTENCPLARVGSEDRQVLKVSVSSYWTVCGVLVSPGV